MRSFFFGTGRRLYGALHEAKGSAKSTGVLLCYPGVQEYNMTHWAFRKLSGLLTREGVHVMRFDYSCSGDSEGDVYDADLSHHIEDIATAADELKDQADVRRVSIVGMRLGALLATQAVANGLEVRDLVLWEPVLRGDTYIRELEHLDYDICTRRHHRVMEPRTELAGYPFPTAMRSALGALDLSTVFPKKVARVSMFLAQPSPEATAARSAWEQAGIKVGSQIVTEQSGGVTRGAGEGDSAVLYTSMLTAIATELTQARGAVAA